MKDRIRNIIIILHAVSNIKDECVTFESITKTFKILQIVLLLYLNISVKFEYNFLISL